MNGINDFKALLETLALDTSIGEAFGPYATLCFIGLGVALAGVTLSVIVRDVVEQVRGPSALTRPPMFREPEAESTPAV